MARKKSKQPEVKPRLFKAKYKCGHKVEHDENKVLEKEYVLFWAKTALCPRCKLKDK